MPILAGFHVEGHDHLVLRAFAARILDLPEQEIIVDFIDSPGRGWQFVLEFIPNALKRFYSQCAQFAVIGVDNDGNLDLDQAGGNQDPNHPRHELHANEPVANCRHCLISEAIAVVRPQLNWIPQKPGAAWPILVAVPVEVIETWLLLLRGEPNIQRRPRSVQKQRLYGRPAATKNDVESIAIPLVRSATFAALNNLAEISASFRNFRDQILSSRAAISANTPCW